MASNLTAQEKKNIIQKSIAAENIYELKIQRVLDDELAELEDDFERLQVEEEDISEAFMNINSWAYQEEDDAEEERPKQNMYRKRIEAANTQVYQKGIDDLVNALAGQIKFEPSFGKINENDKKRIAKITKHTVAGLGSIKSSLKSPITNTIIEGRDLGESHTSIAERVQAVWGGESYRSRTFARTMANHTYNSAQLSKMKDVEIERAEIFAVMDERTSPICIFMNGTIFEVNDPEAIWPPYHFNCRTKIVAQLSDEYPVDDMGGLLERDYSQMSDGSAVSQDFVDLQFQKIDTFKSKYWSVPI